MSSKRKSKHLDEATKKVDEVFARLMRGFESSESEEEPQRKKPQIKKDETEEVVAKVEETQKIIKAEEVASVKEVLTSSEQAPPEDAPFWWLGDAVDKSDGAILLFGKMYNGRDYESACLLVEGIPRNVFFPLRHGSTSEQLGEEVSELMQREVSDRGYDWAGKIVQRGWAFDDSLPRKEPGTYMKVIFPYSLQSFAPVEGSSFLRPRGTNTTALEHLLLKKGLKGPCWIGFKEGAFEQSNSQSTCKQEYRVSSYKNLLVKTHSEAKTGTACPRLLIASISIQTLFTKKNIADLNGTHEIVQISALIHSFSLDTNKGQVIDKLSLIRGANLDEKQLLSSFISFLERHDPDALLGYDIHSFQLQIILQRMKHLQVENRHKLGRLNNKRVPDKLATSGRLVVDVLLAAREHVRSKSYTLAELSEKLLSCPYQWIPMEDISSYLQDEKRRLILGSNGDATAELIYKLAERLQIVPLSRTITCLTGGLWTRTLVGGRAERNEYLLLHEFHEHKYLVPEKNPLSQTKEDAGTYTGGLVLEPKSGLYATLVLLLDFNSLYPSIIQRYNICHTTISENENFDTLNEEEVVREGILPRILQSLVRRRRALKAQLKSCPPEDYLNLNIRQQALKLTANSMYGCLGMAGSRFYARHLAAMVTRRGRETLEDTVSKIKQSGYSVIYGDTDSVMIDTRTDALGEALRIADEIKETINSQDSILEIGLDGIFKRLLLLKKKRYAALVLEADGKKTRIEMKGLDAVRRDWSGLAVRASNQCLEWIMDENESDPRRRILDYLSDLGRKIRQQPADLFIITKVNSLFS